MAAASRVSGAARSRPEPAFRVAQMVKGRGICSRGGREVGDGDGDGAVAGYAVGVQGLLHSLAQLKL